ncbi:DUF4124 domain-containing protein, partial [Candidatus Parcubacteria bacterium]
MEIWRKSVRSAIGLCVGVLLSAAAYAQQVYRWVDKKGVVHFTDDPEKLPEPKRSEALRNLKVRTGTKRHATSFSRQESSASPGTYKVPRNERTAPPLSG